MGRLSSSAAVAPGTCLTNGGQNRGIKLRVGTGRRERREEELCPSARFRTGKGCGAHARTKESAAQGAWPQTLGGHVAITTETALPTPHLAFANFEDASAFGSDVGREMKEREGGREEVDQLACPRRPTTELRVETKVILMPNT